MNILILDNYDSFTYNLVHIIEKISDCTVHVHRNDKIKLEQIEHYDKIVLSPGPGLPSDAGILIPLIQRFYKTKSILGICLGHQAIAEVYGGNLINLDEVLHGVSLPVVVQKKDVIFDGIPNSFLTGRYHSWVVDKNIPDALEVLARDKNGNVMALRHKEFDVKGVQFHPESVLTEFGEKLLKNWLYS
ncbi:MAG: aminodeoxychorismate/anthranilate synthase component II [Bacteroidetes bacterium]|nr:aminodeoxychorismate/anthranilate synthase component II [Bacteroidota bacterium]HET6243438.1 aminodeoxychorismate/anthranilate synthase component II [Bacteroidia bacterium]